MTAEAKEFLRSIEIQDYKLPVSLDGMPKEYWLSDLMNDYAIAIAQEAVDEEKAAWGSSSNDAILVLDELLINIETKLTEDS